MLEKTKSFLDFMLSDCLTFHFKDYNFTISWSTVLGFISGPIVCKLIGL